MKIGKRANFNLPFSKKKNFQTRNRLNFKSMGITLGKGWRSLGRPVICNNLACPSGNFGQKRPNTKFLNQTYTQNNNNL
ncbi:hypothetical protein DDT91_14905 [Algoriphagus sp. AK58]|nr:hypothetical protein [Algoriphagus sp. AK58]